MESVTPQAMSIAGHAGAPWSARPIALAKPGDRWISFLPFDPSDVRALSPLSVEGARLGDVTPETVRHLVHPDLAWTGWLDDRAIGAAGLMDVGQGRAHAWAWLAPDLPRACWRQMLPFMRGILDLAHVKGFRRIECQVRVDLKPGHRLALALGFKAEGLGRCWMPDGSDAIYFGRVARSKQGGQ